MDLFITKHSLNLTQEAIEKISCPKYIKENEFIIKNLQRKKTPDPEYFPKEFEQTYKDKNNKSYTNIFLEAKPAQP